MCWVQREDAIKGFNRLQVATFEGMAKGHLKRSFEDQLFRWLALGLAEIGRWLRAASGNGERAGDHHNGAAR